MRMQERLMEDGHSIAPVRIDVTSEIGQTFSMLGAVAYRLVLEGLQAGRYVGTRDQG